MTLNLSHNLTQLEKIIAETALVAMIQQEPAEISEINNLEFKESYDDLDYLIYAILPLSLGNQVSLIRHKHSPDSGLEICVRHDQSDIPKVISEALYKLNLDRNDLTWINPKYEKHLDNNIFERNFSMRALKYPEWDEFHDDEIVDWKRARSAIEHENQLTNHRITWLLTSQGFLFAAFVLVFQASTKDVFQASPKAVAAVAAELKPLYQTILSGLAITGIFVSLYLRIILRAAEIQHEILRLWWMERIKNSNSNHPPISGVPSGLLRILPSSSFPILFVFSWIVFVLIVLLDFIKPYATQIGLILLWSTVALGLVIFGFMLRGLIERWKPTNNKPTKPFS